MKTNEWSKIWHNAQLDIRLLQAYHVRHAYPRHSHDYYVISLIERGRRSFTHSSTKHLTVPGGIILINPGAVHRGEAVDERDFEMRSLYPAVAHMQMAVFELTGRHQALPFFKDSQVDHPWAMNSVLSLHKAITEGATTLECESRFIPTPAQLINRYADISSSEGQPGKEKRQSGRRAAISRRILCRASVYMS